MAIPSILPSNLKSAGLHSPCERCVPVLLTILWEGIYLMDNKLKTILSGTGFYALLAVCLLAVGVGGWFMLFRQGETVPGVPEPTVETGGVPDLYVPAEETVEPEIPEKVTETAAPEPVEVEIVPTMPELPVDSTPVAAVAPRLVVSPLNGEVLAAFSVDALAYNPTLEDWRIHDGVDIAAQTGSTVLAASSGTVSAVLDDPMIGTTVVIEHDGGYQTTYSNLQTIPTVEAGDAVSAGQIIGAVGATAAAEAAQSPHLHFSVSKNGELVDPDEFLER